MVGLYMNGLWVDIKIKLKGLIYIPMSRCSVIQFLDLIYIPMSRCSVIHFHGLIYIPCVRMFCNTVPWFNLFTNAYELLRLHF